MEHYIVFLCMRAHIWVSKVTINAKAQIKTQLWHFVLGRKCIIQYAVQIYKGDTCHFVK